MSAISEPTTIFFIPREPVNGASDEVRAQAGAPVSLPCRVDTAQCGELHSVKWYRDNHRVFVFSHVANIRRPEGEGSDRMDVEYTPNSSVSNLHIKDVEVTDEGLYKCEKTYLEVRENCDVVQVIKLRTLVRPQAVRILGRDGSALGNATTLGPFNEGTEIELECEAAGAKPVPQITWYNGSNIIEGVYSSEDGKHGVGTARSKLRLTLQRGDLFTVYKCVVESDALDEPIVSWLKADVHVRPTKLELTGVRSYVVQGTNVLLHCNVFGARPEAHVTWYNGSEPITSDSVQSSAVISDDGTYITSSELVFTSSRFENGQTLTCEAENKVLKEQMERPLHQKLKLEVLYPPIVTVSPENVTVNESQDVTFLCSYVANPAKLLSVSWYKNDQILTLNEEHYEGGTVDNPPLIIKNVTRDDMGDYHCVLKNSVGSQASWNYAGLNVLFKPVVELRMVPSNIVKALDRINVTMFCDVASGNPDTLLRVRWYMNEDILKELPDENCTNDINSDRTFCDLDPSRLLLEDVAIDFAGNYSCSGMNEAGWGPVSDETELIVYYPPSQALVRYEPSRVIKKSSVTLYCSVDDPGKPENTQYMWLRGNHVVRNATNAKWTIPQVTFEADSNFTCIAYNEGGQSPPGTVNIEVLAPPAFIVTLQPYTGALMNSKNISISCRVECSPLCSVTWLKNGRIIDDHNHLYYVNNTRYPPDLRTYDFESIQSVLNWNMSAWPNEQLDRINDNANYTCQSSSNGVGQGVTSTTLFAVEYPPENITVSTKKVSVVENHIPQRVICSAKAHPEVSYTWHRDTPTPETFSKGNALMLGAVSRTTAGNYVCKAFNRHGSTTDKTYLNVMYKPECVITQTEYNGNPALVCTAHANPREVTFTWRVKGMNETPEDMRSVEQQGLKSFLLLDSSVDTFRTYVCYANNTVDVSVPCERDVAGTIAWWKRLDNDNLLIIIAIVVGIVVCVIIVCIIIIIVCRRKRANNKSPSPLNTADKNGNPTGNATDPVADPENKTLYENLPFHGMQNPPNKPYRPEFSDLDYADVDYHYGPINYKAASVYAQMKKNKKTNKLQDSEYDDLL
ncbi:neuromusculin [Carabus blaptoides fortunei]